MIKISEYFIQNDLYLWSIAASIILTIWKFTGINILDITEWNSIWYLCNEWSLISNIVLDIIQIDICLLITNLNIADFKSIKTDYRRFSQSWMNTEKEKLEQNIQTNINLRKNKTLHWIKHITHFFLFKCHVSSRGRPSWLATTFFSFNIYQFSWHREINFWLPSPVSNLRLA